MSLQDCSLPQTGTNANRTEEQRKNRTSQSRQDGSDRVLYWMQRQSVGSAERSRAVVSYEELHTFLTEHIKSSEPDADPGSDAQDSAAATAVGMRCSDFYLAVSDSQDSQAILLDRFLEQANCLPDLDLAGSRWSGDRRNRARRREKGPNLRNSSFLPPQRSTSLESCRRLIGIVKSFRRKDSFDQGLCKSKSRLLIVTSDFCSAQGLRSRQVYRTKSVQSSCPG